MSGQGVWLSDSLDESKTLQGLGISVEELKSNYLRMMETIVADKRNYMATVIGDQKEYLITSKLADMIELVDPSQYANGTDFKVIGTKISIAASRVISTSADVSVWTLDKILAEMEDNFLSVRKDVDSAIKEGYAGTTNLISVDNIDTLNSHNVSKKTVIDIGASSMIVKAQNTSEKGITTADNFVSNFITKDGINDSNQILATFGAGYTKVKLNSSEVEEIVLNISDGDLSGAGSKLTDYAPTTVASASSPSVTNIDFPLDHTSLDDGEYFIAIDGVDYSYVALEGDTADMIALELETALTGVSGVTVLNEDGIYGVVYENANLIKSLGVWNNDTTTGQTYEVYLEENPDGIGPVGYTVEDTNGDGTTLTVYLPLDDGGFTDPDSTLQGLVDAINGAAFWDGGAMVMPGEDPSEPFDSDVGMFMTLAQTTSRVNVILDSAVTIEQRVVIGGTTYNDLGKKEVVSAFSVAQDQLGTVEILALNQNAVMSITIDGVPFELDLSQPEYESIVSPSMAAIALGDIITLGATEATVSVTGAIITLSSANAGTSFTVATSGESIDFAVALARDVMLKHDIQNHMSLSERSASPLKIVDEVPTTDSTVIGRPTLKRMVDNGYLYSKNAMLWPNLDYRFSQEDITTQRNSVNVVDTLIAKYENGFEPRDTSFVSKAFPVLTRPMSVPARSKSDRWFFLEAKPTVIASKRSVDIVLNTITPKDFEQQVLLDTEATFSTILEASTPSGFFEAESISRLVNEKPKGRAMCDFNLSVNTQMEALTVDTINLDEDVFYETPGEFSTMEIIDGFMLRSILPDDLRGKLSIDGFNHLFRIALYSVDELREQRFIELAGMLVLSSDQLGTNMYIPQAASYVFGTDSAPTSPVVSNGIDGIPVNGTLTMDRLYFRNFRDVVLNDGGEHVSVVSAGQEHGIEMLLIRALDMHPEIVDASAQSIYDSEAYLETYAEAPLSEVNDVLVEELIRTGYFPGDVSPYINNIGNGMSAMYKDSVMNTLMEAIEINDFMDIISVGSAKTMMHDIYVNKKTTMPLSAIDLTMMMMPYDAYNANSEVNIASGLFNLCMKTFLHLQRLDAPFADYELTFQDIQVFIFDETDDTIDTIPFLAFEMFLSKIGFLRDNVGDTDIDVMIAHIETSMATIIPSVADKSIFNAVNGSGFSMDASDGIKFNPVTVMTHTDTKSSYNTSFGVDITVTEAEARAMIDGTQFADRSASFVSANITSELHGATVTENAGTYTLAVDNTQNSTASVSFVYADMYGAITTITITSVRND